MTGLLLAAAVAIAGQDDGGTLSPLHSYLGIDAESGEFADKPAATTPADAERPPEEAAEKAAREVRQVVERVADGDLSELGGLLNAAGGSPLGETARLAMTVSVAVLLIYPLSIVLVELASAAGRRGETLEEVDRRHFRRRRRLRLLSAAAAAGAIGLLTWAHWEWFWLDRPEVLAAVGAGLAACLLAWSTLAGLVRRADAEYPAAVLRGVRDRQAELALDLADLRRRLAKTPGAAA